MLKIDTDIFVSLHDVRLMNNNNSYATLVLLAVIFQVVLSSLAVGKHSCFYSNPVILTSKINSPIIAEVVLPPMKNCSMYSGK